MPLRSTLLRYKSPEQRRRGEARLTDLRFAKLGIEDRRVRGCLALLSLDERAGGMIYRTVHMESNGWTIR